MLHNTDLKSHADLILEIEYAVQIVKVMQWIQLLPALLEALKEVSSHFLKESKHTSDYWSSEWVLWLHLHAFLNHPTSGFS